MGSDLQFSTRDDVVDAQACGIRGLAKTSNNGGGITGFF
jgi:hypothetical protein